MAVAVQAAGMGTQEGAGVHPFFSSVKRKEKALTAAPKNAELFPDKGPNERTTPTTTIETDTRPKPPTHILADDGPSAQLQRSAASEADNGRPVWFLDQSKSTNLGPQLGKGVSNGHKGIVKNHQGPTTTKLEDWALDDIKRWHNVGNEAGDFEVDLNDSRRKRRRTTSVQSSSSRNSDIAQGSWLEQLRAAARSTPTVQVNGKERLQDTTQNTEMDVWPLLTTSTSSLLSQRPSLEPLKDNPDARNSVVGQPAPTEKGTPQKKMLKIRSDGKLASPKARTEGAISNSRRKSSRKDQTDSKYSRLVVLRYGIDAQRRASLGAEIERVLAGGANNENISPVKDKASGVLQKAQVPPKTTHPFFLGKQSRLADSSTGEIAGAIGVNTVSLSKTSEHTSPRKKISTVTPSAAKAWAAIAEQGSASEGRALAKVTRFPGAVEPIWPPRNMQHCRGLRTTVSANDDKTVTVRCWPKQKRLKTTEVRVTPREDVLLGLRGCYLRLTESKQNNDERSKLLRKPERKLMTGPQLQESLRSKLVAELPHRETTVASAKVGQQVSREFVPGDKSSTPAAHSALLRIYEGIADSLSGFDRFECESRDWVLKYSPKDATSVLQQGREVALLRDWLKSLTVISVDSGNRDKLSIGDILSVPRRGVGRPRKRKKKDEGLDGFVVSSDEDAGEMDELAGPDDELSANSPVLGAKKSMVRIVSAVDLFKSTDPPPAISNAVVISGPHGCGKTAAVYAVAQELGFEVFEINSGSRRSGKDILDRVGDMTRNHLVHQAEHTDGAGEDEESHSAALQQDIDSGRQRTMQSFLKPKTTSKSISKARSKTEKTKNKNKSPPKNQNKKQSLILLEEVDILFEEDKQFWNTITGLILQSRRPIIMTCTDESRLPLEDLVLHAIFRLTPPAQELAVDYLILIAGNEGHLLSRDAVRTLYVSKNQDLRASITELNLWCQMAVGDTKGGLEWMLIGSKACHNAQGERLRVVSDDTYPSYMGCFGRDRDHDGLETGMSTDLELLSEALQRPDAEVDHCSSRLDGALGHIEFQIVDPLYTDSSRQSAVQILKNFDLVVDAQSAGDLLHGFGSRPDITTRLDTSQPELTEKTRQNYIEGFPVLQAEPKRDPTNLSTLLPLAITASTHLSNSSLGLQPPRPPALPTLLLTTLTPHLTSPSHPLPTLASDIAPYVRAIVAFDLRLESQRRHLSSLLSENGRNGKRPRTTRASRAALEGGNKASTRRERWFPKSTNFPLVLRTGGKEWPAVAVEAQVGQVEREEGGRRAEVGVGSGEGKGLGAESADGGPDGV
ncbi:hypothetical protein MMC13_007513 [Lambiella insularis]|nr:hypothetical protein [Lambiella insularis]